MKLLYLGYCITIAGAIVTSCSDSPQFDSAVAYSDLEKICSYGPRVANTESHLKAGEYIYNSLKQTSDICRVQRFTVYDSVHNVSRDMFNIISSYYPRSKKRIMLCAHWDSRPISDMEPDSSKRNLPILGANDGASGVAVLLEMARILKDHQPPVGVDIVLFDGEDYGTKEWPGGWFLGSRHFTEKMGGYKPRLAVLIDMIGDADLKLYKEAISQKYAPKLNNYIWEIAAELKVDSFINADGDTISDDHIPLLANGIKSIDIIDLDYPYWHTQEDTPDKCSAESLGEVGKVLTAAIFDKRIEDF